MRDIWSMTLRLFIIAAVAALALGLTNYVTKEPIREQTEIAKTEARLSVLPSASEFSKVDIESLKTNESFAGINEIYEDTGGSGYTVNLTTKGFGGAIGLTVGINSDGTVQGIEVGDNSETPGLGAKAAENDFGEQFIGLPDQEITVVKNGAKDGEVQAITGATITSNAIVSGVNTAREAVKALKGEK